MLIITRKVGEALMIGDDICVRIAEPKNTHGNCVRVGIEAPKDVRIVREELQERDAAEGASPDRRHCGEPK